MESGRASPAPSRQVTPAGRWIVRAAWAAWSATLLSGVGKAPLEQANADGPLLTGIASAVGAILVLQSMATIGVLIVRSDPLNAEGWLFCAAPLLMSAGNLLGTYAEYALITNPGTLPVGTTAGALGNGWLMGTTLFASFLVLLFPDGRLPGPRWRPVAWIGAASLGVLWIGLVIDPEHLEAPLQRFDNPLAVDGARYIRFLGILVPVLIAAGIVGAALRYRRGSAAERLQLRWFVAAVCLTVVIFVGTGIFTNITGHEAPSGVYTLNFFLVPAAVGFAILRHRLYGIDVIIRRTLVYGTLVAVLALLYLGGVALLGWVFRSITGAGSTLGVTLTTLAVAVAFQPLRARIRRSVDRRFFRQTYDAATTLAAFGRQLRDQIEIEALEADVLGVVGRTLAPAHASLWLPAGRGDGDRRPDR